MAPDIIEAGRVYDTNGRKGPLTVRVLTTFDNAEDTFFDAEIIEGKVRYLSVGNNLEQKATGMGTAGDVIRMRTTLTTLLKRRRELEADDPKQDERNG